MVQWFKKLLLFITGKPQVYMLLDFNIKELSTKMEKTAVEIHRHKGDDALELIRLAIDTARNITILEVQKAKADEINFHRGRLQALSDLGQFIELALDDEHYKLLKDRKSDEVKPKILKKVSHGSVGPVI